MDNLVRRLREVGGFDPAAELCSHAADRIEQLTGELNKAVKLGKAGGYKATPEHSWAEWCDELYRDLNKANDRIEQLEAALQKINERLNDKDSWLAQSIDARKIAEAAMRGNNGGQDRQSD